MVKVNIVTRVMEVDRIYGVACSYVFCLLFWVTLLDSHLIRMSAEKKWGNKMAEAIPQENYLCALLLFPKIIHSLLNLLFVLSVMDTSCTFIFIIKLVNKNGSFPHKFFFFLNGSLHLHTHMGLARMKTENAFRRFPIPISRSLIYGIGETLETESRNLLVI